jgi:hypothetical protein
MRFVLSKIDQREGGAVERNPFSTLLTTQRWQSVTKTASEGSKSTLSSAGTRSALWKTFATTQT